MISNFYSRSVLLVKEYSIAERNTKKLIGKPTKPLVASSKKTKLRYSKQTDIYISRNREYRSQYSQRSIDLDIYIHVCTRYAQPSFHLLLIQLRHMLNRLGRAIHSFIFLYLRRILIHAQIIFEGDTTQPQQYYPIVVLMLLFGRNQVQTID